MNEFRDKLLTQSVIGPRDRSKTPRRLEALRIVRDENGHDTISHESGRVDVNINVREPVRGSMMVNGEPTQ